MVGKMSPTPATVDSALHPARIRASPLGPLAAHRGRSLTGSTVKILRSHSHEKGTDSGKDVWAWHPGVARYSLSSTAVHAQILIVPL